MITAGMEQADRVGRDRVAKARMELLGDRGAADDRVLLEHQHAQTRAGEIGRASQAIVAGSDDDDVVAVSAHAVNCTKTRRRANLGRNMRRIYDEPAQTIEAAHPTCRR